MAPPAEVPRAGGHDRASVVTGRQEAQCHGRAEAPSRPPAAAGNAAGRGVVCVRLLKSERTHGCAGISCGRRVWCLKGVCVSAREEGRASGGACGCDRPERGGAGRSGGDGHGATAGAATVFSLLRDVSAILRRGERVATADPEQSGDLGSIFDSPRRRAPEKQLRSERQLWHCLRTCCNPPPPHPTHCSTERPDAARVT